MKLRRAGVGEEHTAVEQVVAEDLHVTGIHRDRPGAGQIEEGRRKALVEVLQLRDRAGLGAAGDLEARHLLELLEEVHVGAADLVHAVVPAGAAVLDPEEPHGIVADTIWPAARLAATLAHLSAGTGLCGIRVGDVGDLRGLLDVFFDVGILVDVGPRGARCIAPSSRSTVRARE